MACSKSCFILPVGPVPLFFCRASSNARVRRDAAVFLRFANRLKQATEAIPNQTGWQTSTFDRYGNRNFVEANTTTLPKNCVNGTTPVVCAADVPRVNPSVNATNNRLDGYTFDPSGNTTVDADGRQFAYDAETIGGSAAESAERG